MKPIELDQFGLAIWRNKYSKYLFAERSYEWVDRVVVIDEHDGRREIVDDLQFSKFNFADWIPVTKEEFAKAKNYYKDIYE